MRTIRQVREQAMETVWATFSEKFREEKYVMPKLQTTDFDCNRFNIDQQMQNNTLL